MWDHSKQPNSAVRLDETNDATTLTELYPQDLGFEVVSRKLKGSLWKHKRQIDFLLFYFEKEGGLWKWTSNYVDGIQE